jgi:hypothetical protein
MKNKKELANERAAVDREGIIMVVSLIIPSAANAIHATQTNRKTSLTGSNK